MDIRHSSTGRRIINNGLDRKEPLMFNPKHPSIESIDLSLLLASPDSSNRLALSNIRKRIEENKDLEPPSLHININTSREMGLRNTFLSVFPSRSSKFRKNLPKNRINAFEDFEPPKKHWNRRADNLSSHRDAMIRASNLFALYPR